MLSARVGTRYKRQIQRDNTREDTQKTSGELFIGHGRWLAKNDNFRGQTARFGVRRVEKRGREEERIRERARNGEGGGGREGGRRLRTEGCGKSWDGREGRILPPVICPRSRKLQVRAERKNRFFTGKRRRSSVSLSLEKKRGKGRGGGGGGKKKKSHDPTKHRRQARRALITVL